MATIQERLNRMREDDLAADVQRRLDRMKQDGQTAQAQKAPVVTPGQGSGPSLQAGGITPPAGSQGRVSTGGISSLPAELAPAVTLRGSRQAAGQVVWRSQMTDPRAAMEQVLSSSAKRRTSQDIRTEMDGLDSAIGEMKRQHDVLKSQAGQVSGRGGQGAGDYWAQLNSQAKELEKQIAQLESDRAGLQSRWNRADQTEFDLKMLRDPEYRAAADRAMAADYGRDTVDSRKPAHRDVGYAMTYFQAKARGDEQLAASAMEHADMALDRMSESQRNRLAWYVGTGDYDGAAEYLNRIVPELNQAEARDVEQALSDWAKERPIQGAAVNITSWPFNIPAYFSNAGQTVKNAVTGKDEQNPHLSANVGTRIGTGTSQGTQQAAREAATQAFGSETAGEVASFLVGTGLSIGQNVGQIAMLGPGSLAAMGFSAAGSATQDVLDRGGTPQQAFLVGTSAGAIEAITEKIPLDNLFRLAREGGGKGLKSAVIEALKEMGTEASEEMISEIANNLVDTAVMGDRSEFQLYVKELQEAGLSKEEAERAALQQFYITNVFMSGLGGAISGGVMGGGAMAFNKAGQYAAQLSGDTQSTQRTTDAIDRAYQAMVEKGMFSQEAGQAVQEARDAQGQHNALLPTGEALRDARDGLYLPTAEQGTVTLPGGENVVQTPQRVGEGQAEERQPADFREQLPLRSSAETPQAAAQTKEANVQQAAPNLDTSVQGKDIAPEEQHRKEIQQVVQTLREDYAQGRMTEEAFDGAMARIEEEASFAGISLDELMDTPLRGKGLERTTGGEWYDGSETGPDGNQLSGGGQERALDQGAGGQVGGLAEGGSRRTADTGRRAVDRQNVGRDLRLQTVSARELGIDSGTDARNIRVLPESAWDGGLRDTARKVRRETGKGIRFVLGGIQVTGSDGAVHQVRGAYSQDGIIVQADHMRVSPEQIADHEIFHDYVQQDPGLIRAVEDAIAERYGREELRGILAEYAKGLRGIVDVSEDGTALGDDQALEDLKNEVFADAYAGINAFAADAGRYQGEVLDTLEGRGVSDTAPGREYAEAVDSRTGPPVEQFSYEGRTEDGIEVYETSEEIRGLPYKQRIDIFLDLMRNEYKGRTAKFTANDGEVYYARFSEKDLGKNIYGDKRSSAGGIKAKVNVGADGGVFELVENAQYVGSRVESGKRSRVHSGVVSWDYFVKTVQIDGQVYDLLANVRKKPGGEYVYSIQLNESTTKAPAPSLASSHSENGDAQNRMLTGASEKFGAPDASSHTHTTEVGADRQGPSDVSKTSIAQPEAAVKDGRVMLPTGEQGTVTAPRADDFGGMRFSADEDQDIPDGLTLPTLADVTAQRNRAQSEAAESTAENVSNSGTIEVEAAVDSPVDTLPPKAREYLKRAERQLTGKIGELLSVPRSAQRAFLQDIVREVSNEYLNTGKVSQETLDRLFEQAYDQGIQVDREYYDEYKPVRDYLRSTPITVSQWLKGDMDDYNGWRKGAFGTIRLVNKGGTDVETAYAELQRIAPALFPADVTHPGDQLRHILETAQGIRMTERSLNEYYGPDAEEFKRYTRRDFDEAVDDALRDLKQVKRYADERSRVKEGPQVPTSVQEVTELWNKKKDACRAYQRVLARNLLTEHDEVQVGRLLRGELELVDLDPSRDNVKGITAVFEAKQEYEDLAGRIREWNKQRKAGLMERADGFLENAVEWKDKKAGILYARETMERNIRDIVPDRELADRINRAYFQPVHEAAAKSNRAKNEYRDRVRDMKLSRKVAKSNTVSEAHAVQLLGEAEDNIRILEQSQGKVEKRDGKTIQEWQYVIGKLWEENPGLDQAKIREAVNRFRTIYDELFQQMNEARVRNGYEPVNYRQGYFPHFQPGSEGIMALFGRALGIDTAVDSLPTTINGLTHTFKPGIQWFGNAQERLGFNTAYDAVEGFDRYIEGVADVIYQTDNIQALRALASQVRYRTTNDQVRAQIDQVRARTDISAEEKTTLIDEINKNGKFSLGNFVVELDEYTNLLANKKSRGDRDMEQNLGRRMYKLAKGLESRVAANMVAVNLASWLTNFVPLTQGAATLDRGMLLKGMWDTLKAYHTDDGFVGMSSFLTNRRGSDPLVKTWSQGASAVLSAPMEYIDQFTSDSLVRARFAQNVKKGLSEAAAIDEADAWAAGVMADRSKGAMPTLFSQTNPLTKVFTQFQLEVNNQLSYLFKDLPQDMKEKGLGALCAALLKFFVGAFLYNEVYEYFIGRRCALDPIGILNDSVGDFTGYELPSVVDLVVGAATGETPSFETEKKSVNEAALGLVENVADEIPFVGSLIGGGRLPAFNAVDTLGGLFDAATKTEWAPEKRLSEAAKALSGPATYLTLPFGGGQIKKIYQGLKAIDQGGSYTVDSQGNEILQYPVYNGTGMDKASSLAGALLFGKSSLPTARDWADSGFKSLNAGQTACYQRMTELGVSQRDAFELLQEIGKIKSPEDKDAPATAKQAYQQRKVLAESDISGEGKSVVYYGLMASEKEQSLMDELSDSGADMGEVTRVLMELKDANALEAGKSDAKKEAIVSSTLSELEKDAVFRYVLPEESKGTKWSTQLADAGLDRSSAVAVANALNSLTPGEGRSTVAEVQQWRAVLDTAKGTADQKAALLTVMSDSARMKYEIADGCGIEPEAWVQLKEALPQFDANENGSYSGAEIENAIDALCGDGSLVAPWDKVPLRLSREDKAVLWQLYTGSTSGKNNPYSSRVGNETGKALEKAKEEAEKEKK